jgi:hypothetical protein
MSYTLEQKAVAYVENTLWWRFPDNSDSDHRRWTRVADDIAPIKTRELQDDKAEYFIGPTPPRVLSELEGELLEALKEVFEQCDGYVPNTSKATWRKAAAVISKAEGTE